jgi:hypothetical protein
LTKFYPGDVVRYRSELMPRNPMMVVGVTQDAKTVALQPVGPAQQGAGMIRAEAEELIFLSHSTQRLAEVVFHLHGALKTTVDQESIGYLSMLREILDPDGSLTKLAEAELERLNAPPEAPEPVTDVPARPSGLVNAAGRSIPSSGEPA